jgi:hypothetical protein
MFSGGLQSSIKTEIAMIDYGIILGAGSVPWELIAVILTSFLTKEPRKFQKQSTAFWPETFLRTDFFTVMYLRHQLCVHLAMAKTCCSGNGFWQNRLKL